MVVVQHVDSLRGKGIVSSNSYRAGDVIFSMREFDIMGKPDRYSIQLGFATNLDTKGCGLDNLNHSCSPNTHVTFIDGVVSLCAIGDIELGEELTFNYLATEFELEFPFECQCQSPSCYGQIRGYSYLNEIQRGELRTMALPYLRDL